MQTFYATTPNQGVATAPPDFDAPITDWAPDPMYLGTGDPRDPQIGFVDPVQAAGNAFAWMDD
jgi:hypothetical protein